MRLDKFLWFVRFAKTRAMAQDLIGAGRVRINRARISRAATRVKVGDVIVVSLPSGMRVAMITTLPVRRGPAAEAQRCYRALDGVRVNPIADTDLPDSRGTLLP